jgi:hypothetical protein
MNFHVKGTIKLLEKFSFCELFLLSLIDLSASNLRVSSTMLITT